MRAWIIFAFISFQCLAQSYTIASWNIRDLGDSKNKYEMSIIAQVIQEFDVVAIQEVVGSQAGLNAVKRLIKQLNSTDAEKDWKYWVSKKTISSSANSAERYAFVWQEERVQMKDKPWYFKGLIDKCEREPSIANFQMGNKVISIVNFHALPKKRHPEKELKYFKHIPESSLDKIFVFVGDFNLAQKHTVFDPLKKMGFAPSIIKQKTTLKDKKYKGVIYANQTDNIFYPIKSLRFIEAGVVNFTDTFKTLKEAKKISDHVPVYLQFE